MKFFNSTFRFRAWLFGALLCFSVPCFAGREYDGSNMYLDFGSDSSIDDFTTLTVAFWVQKDVNVAGFLGKHGFTSGWEISSDNTTDVIGLDYGRATTRGIWKGTVALGTGLRHVVMTYDNTSTSNNPIFYVDGAVDGTNISQAPVGAAAADAGNNAFTKDNSFNFLFTDGRVGWMAWDNTIWTAAQVNRHRWWGRVGGAIKVQLPLVTSNLNNEGTATANPSNTGTTMIGIPKVQRPGSGLLGLAGGF